MHDFLKGKITSLDITTLSFMVPLIKRKYVCWLFLNLLMKASPFESQIATV